MNLLEKNTQYLLRVLPLVLIICSIIFFIFLKIQTTHLQEVQLLLKQENVLNKFNTGHLDSTENVVGEYEISVNKPINSKALKTPVDTLIYYPLRGEYVPFQMRTSIIERNGRIYQLTTYVSSVEITHLIIAALGVQLLIYVILLFSIIKINKRLSKALWRPFYKTMAKLEKYDISSSELIQLDKSTSIAEFDELNDVILKLTERNQQAFNSQKEFVENAAHEMQTPLAIIRSKIELLSEQANLNNLDAELLDELFSANDRMIKLNKTLSLLSKIENNQFSENTKINLSFLIKNLFQQFQGYDIKNFPKVTLNVGNDVILYANLELIEILLRNLLWNAIIHNVPDGYLTIELFKSELLIENSGKPLFVNPQVLFERFTVGDKDSKKSSGLGLALVQQICNIYEYRINYTYNIKIHRVKINFPSI